VPLNVTHYRAFRNDWYPIVSKMHWEMSGEPNPDGRRQPDAMIAKAGHCLAICQVFVWQCAPTLLLTIENRFRWGYAHFKSARDASLRQAGHSLFVIRP
jgi:hypothetical protein